MHRFAVLDLAKAVPLRLKVTELASPQGLPLLSPTAYPELIPVGPWLIDLAQCPAIVATWKQTGRWKSWGYTVHSDRDIEALTRHFRKFNLVEMEGQKDPVFFRYFDAVVLKTFLLDVFDKDQIFAFMDGIYSIMIEDPDQRTLLNFDQPYLKERSKSVYA